MEPKTGKEKLQAKLPEFLKAAGVSRTASITISGLEYATELSKSLLDHAEKMEAYYKKGKSAVEGNDTSEKSFKKILAHMETLEVENDKLKAQPQSTCLPCSTCPLMRAN